MRGRGMPEKAAFGTYTASERLTRVHCDVILVRCQTTSSGEGVEAFLPTVARTFLGTTR
jgi:hypothetical protein